MAFGPAVLATWPGSPDSLLAVGLVERISQGGVIAYAIVALSVLLATLTLVFAMQFRFSVQCPEELLEEVQERVEQVRAAEAERLVAADTSALAEVLEALLRRRQDSAALPDVLADAVADQASRLGQRVGYIGLIAAVAPMLGLLGTVSGMIRAFETMSVADVAPDATQLAGAISEALVTTYLGLLVAIPALGLSTLFRHRVAHLARRLTEMGEQFLALLRDRGRHGTAPTRKHVS